jgi:hypothetical protein
MAAREKSFREIDGVPVYYMRISPPDLHTATWYCTNAFYTKLVAWKQSLELGADKYGNYGTIEHFVSAGFYVNKPGQHGRGTAMDLDRVKWANGTFASPYYQHHRHSSQTIRRRYYGVEASLRRFFRYVLDGYYPNHHDHIHADLAGMPTVVRKSSRSDTLFVQAALNNFNGSGLAIDGVWGRRTNAAFNDASAKLPLSGSPFSSASARQAWLWEVVRHGFADAAFGQL